MGVAMYLPVCRFLVESLRSLEWASRRPLERRVVAPFTVLMVSGIVVSEIAGATAGVVSIVFARNDPHQAATGGEVR